MAWFGDFIDWYHDNGLIPGLWKGITGQQSQEKMAEENLQYQKDRNKIEDDRYTEETDYNRDFVEDERDFNRAFALNERAYQRQWALNDRDYNRSLQQEIFNREDTAIERQADQLSKLGINPLSQSMNGLGSGSVVSSPTAGSSPAPTSLGVPSASSRGGSALHKDMQVVDSLLPLVQLAGDLTSSIEGVSTGKLNRDALRLENDRKFIENKILAHKNGFDYWDTKHHKNVSWDSSFGLPLDESYGSELFKDAESVRDIKHKFKSGIFSSDTELMKTLKDFSTENYGEMAEKVVTNLASIFNKLNMFGK